MRMGRMNVYLPDDLAEAARSADLNVSAITQAAVREALAAQETDAWLDTLLETKTKPVDVNRILARVREAREELERGHE